MRFLTKAKPVKIRITSGGEEHFSLESLKNNFCVEDVVGILDERLVRWLKQLNAGNITTEIEQLEKDKSISQQEKYLKLYQIFFQDDFEISDFHSLIEFWKDKPQYKRNYDFLINFIVNNEIEGIGSTDYANILFETFNKEYPNLEKFNNIEHIINNLYSKNTPLKILFIKNLCMYEGICGYEQDIDESFKYIYDNKDEFINILTNKILVDRIKNIKFPFIRHNVFEKFNEDYLNIWKQFHWTDKYFFRTDNPSIEDFHGDFTKEVFNFIKDCIIKKDLIGNGYNKHIERFKINKYDVLAFEKQLVNFVLFEDITVLKSFLIEQSQEHPMALNLRVDGVNVIYSSIDLNYRYRMNIITVFLDNFVHYAKTENIIKK